MFENSLPFGEKGRGSMSAARMAYIFMRHGAGALKGEHDIDQELVLDIADLQHTVVGLGNALHGQ